MRTIAIVNQKGGVGKTTTAVQLASGLTMRGYRVLAVDMDSQGNLTTTMRQGAGCDPSRPALFDVLVGRSTTRDALFTAPRATLLPSASDEACADKRLAHLSAEMGEMPNRHFLLKDALSQVEGDFDFAIVDTPPARDICSYNALTAADHALVVTEAGEYAIKGIGDLAESIRQITKYTNPDLRIAGILLTKLESNTLLAKGMRKGVRSLADALGTTMLRTSIRKAVALGETQAAATNIFDYAPESGAAKDYGKFIDELLGVISNG